ncbi:MAG: hypothetical protein DMG40_14885 [Acidobacteria bacterium]|nr:MAG: hypothetical protein DMG40_14885 [Acidobacteriota bacterium]
MDHFSARLDFLLLSLFLAFSCFMLQTVQGARCSLLYSLAGRLLGMVNMAEGTPESDGVSA